MRHPHVRSADMLARQLQAALKHLPLGFLDTFDYTTTGQNLAHPIVLGYLVRAVWRVRGVAAVGVDVRLNMGGGVKFQPDIVAYDNRFEPLFFVDYESPNSSDARIPAKDVDAYCLWRNQCDKVVPYFIITTLPDAEARGWELRWTASGQCNEAFRGRRAQIRKNPFRFWYSHFRKELRSRKCEGVVFINVNGRNASRVFPK